MDFGYTLEQQHLRKTVRAFCEAEIRPHVMEWDESQTFPDQVFRKLGELGVLGAVFPEELGGSGYSYVDYSLVIEELARVDPSIALSVAAHISRMPSTPQSTGLTKATWPGSSGGRGAPSYW